MRKLVFYHFLPKTMPILAKDYQKLPVCLCLQHLQNLHLSNEVLLVVSGYTMWIFKLGGTDKVLQKLQCDTDASVA